MTHDIILSVPSTGGSSPFSSGLFFAPLPTKKVTNADAHEIALTVCDGRREEEEHLPLTKRDNRRQMMAVNIRIHEIRT